MVDLGVSFPVLIKPESLDYEPITIPGPKHAGDATTNGFTSPPGGSLNPSPFGSTMGDGMNMPGGDNGDKKVEVQRFKFRVQFVWQPKSSSEQPAPAAGGAAAVPVNAAGPTGMRPAATSPTTAPVPAAPLGAGPTNK